MQPLNTNLSGCADRMTSWAELLIYVMTCVLLARRLFTSVLLYNVVMLGMPPSSVVLFH